ncbi:MAG: putative acetyl transferase [Microbacteriaceae bacterium]|nr:putative acetyl transferase [Microbacteriaceae bacterium]
MWPSGRVPLVITIATEPRLRADVLALMRVADEYALGLYPAESYYAIDVAELERDHVTLLAARDDGVLAGIVALVDNGDETAEIKRMFVASPFRGRGIAGALLARVEEVAAAASVSLVRLETGPKQPDAIALYEKHGYAHIDAFGQYVGDPSSVCMEKRLG